MTALNTTDVFTPGAFPVHTYVKRPKVGLEERLRDALVTPGQVTSLSGPSKSGKTVLVERVVGQDALIPITGAGLDETEKLWDRVLDWIDAPTETSRSRRKSRSLALGMEGRGSARLGLIAGAEAGASVSLAATGDAVRREERGRRGMSQVVHEIGGSEFAILIDDFHYMPRRIQDDVAKQIKEAARLGVRVITASVPHRSDDVVRANPELRGRVLALDLDYWDEGSLRAIAERGFSLLNVEIDGGTIDLLTREAAGSPQLMQAICLNTCFELGLRESQARRESIHVRADTHAAVLERTAATTDFRSLVDVLDAGPRTRGVGRNTYRFTDATTGDVYRCVLRALATEPATLAFPHADVLERIQRFCVGEAPTGSSIAWSCEHMCRLAEEKFPRERVLDWDADRRVLHVTDPYLLFYLRWSGRLARGPALPRPAA